MGTLELSTLLPVIIVIGSRMPAPTARSLPVGAAMTYNLREIFPDMVSDGRHFTVTSSVIPGERSNAEGEIIIQLVYSLSVYTL
ncbi:hypothetical protein [Methanolobus profundi]|uniref:Uncharacterized protein n=1 Tax=Methanolobus profundi TaxID=487685 RepID=A0A1I4PG02_9EURY|nr:hypothetical protein [Methanolobus profundi]SFM26732.1 hypothetical protein SAMN04488696_0635 [Methanolobus profundi]